MLPPQNNFEGGTCVKKISALMLLLVIVVSLASCGNASGSANNSPLPPDEALQSDYNFLLAEKEALQSEFDAIRAERDALLSKNEKNPVTISGSFTATVQLLIPDYVLDDVTPSVAVVTSFQSQPFTVYLGKDLASQIEVGESYEFEIEEKNVSLTQEQLEAVSTAPEVAIPLYNLKVISVVEVKDNGVDTEGLIFNNSTLHVTAPGWVDWVAKKWDSNPEEWIKTAEADGVDIELWLREHDDYGESKKVWSINSAVKNIGKLKVSSETNPLADEKSRNDVASKLTEMLLSEFYETNEQFSFQFVDVQNVSIVTEWINEVEIWTCTIKADICFEGIILPYGSVQSADYLTIPIGTFELDFDDGVCSLIPVAPDTFERVDVH